MVLKYDTLVKLSFFAILQDHGKKTVGVSEKSETNYIVVEYVKENDLGLAENDIDYFKERLKVSPRTGGP